MDRVDLYGIRLNYRFSGNPSVLTSDFFGPTKATDSEKFLESVRELGKLDFYAFTIVPQEID